MTDDRSNGWDAVADEFMAIRSGLGAATVRAWSEGLPPGARVLDIGAGSGKPVSAALIEDGFHLYAVEPSPRLAAAFTRDFPGVPIACESAEDSDFFGLTFDGVLAIGLMFLLPPEGQCTLIERAAKALRPAGRFLFSAPTQKGEWADTLTGRRSVSLGDDAYKAALGSAGLAFDRSYTDEGGNHYYAAIKGTPTPRRSA